KHKENHKGTVDGDQCQINVGIHHTIGCPFSQQGLKYGKGFPGPSQLHPKEQRHSNTNEPHDKTRDEILLGYHLVVLAEDVLGNKGLLMMMPVIFVSVFVSSS